MPPINQQGSRTGIVTALVIFVILFVTTLILWIYEGAERRKRDDELAERSKKYGSAISEANLGSPEMARLTAAMAENPGQSAFDVLLTERNRLARAATGSETAAGAQVDTEVAAALAAATAKEVGPDAGVTKADSLAGAVRKLAARVVALKAEREALNQQVAAARAETQQTIAGRDALLQEKDKQVAAVTEQMQEAVRSVEAYRTDVGTRVTTISSNAQTELSSLNTNVGALQAQINERDASIKKMQTDMAALKQKLAGLRVDGKEPMMQQADGRIIRLAPNSKDVAMINLGAGNQIVQGMTFEVYDKFTGIPALGKDGTRADEMPVGKASVEVVQIGAGSSQCRIIRRTPGQQLVEGDLIANLVYDPAVKFNFVVYGDFDMDNDGKPSPSDAATLQRLVTQWGGKLMDTVNANTDFLVIGTQPTVEAADESDPVTMKRVQEQQDALNNYEATLKAAQDLGIPILNQNRFLYFTGYRSQAGR